MLLVPQQLYFDFSKTTFRWPKPIKSLRTLKCPLPKATTPSFKLISKGEKKSYWVRVFLTRKEHKHENPLLPWEKKPVKLFKQTANCFKGLIIQDFYFQICPFILIY